jgi:hypothetical protein
MTRLFFLPFLIIVLFINNSCSDRNTSINHNIPLLSVSEDGHYLIKEGKPFFWLGDTGWFLFTQSPEDVEMYMQNRKSHGFNTLQIMVTNKHFNRPEFRKNYRGDAPFTSLDPVEFNEMYFAHIDDIVKKAEKHNMVIALFPTWGWSLDQMFSIEKPENAFDFGFLLGDRYKNYKNVIWSVCGEYHKIAWDTEPKKPDSSPDEKEIARIESLARGLKEGQGGAHLMTIHPDGWKSSTEHFHDAEWLDFNMIQSWSIGKGNEMDTRDDYFRIPAKPTLLAEPGYEFGGGGHQAFEVRYEGYHSVLNGGMGYTYGCEGIWNFKENWKDLLNTEGVFQMQYLKKLFESRSFSERIPAQEMIEGITGDWAKKQKVMAGISKDSTWAVVYFPNDTINRSIKLGTISGDKVNAWWYNPRDGKCYTLKNIESDQPFAEYTKKENKVIEFNPPGSEGLNNDWVLVLDDARKRYSKP